MNQGFSILGVQVYDNCHEHIKKNLGNRIYLFNSWYKENNQELVRDDSSKFLRSLYGKNISVQAIVGKNGSGKSTIMEFVYRIINNLSVIMVRGMERPAADPMCFVRGVYGKLFFESDGRLGSVTCEDNIITFQWGEDKEIIVNGTDSSILQSQEDKDHLEYISRHFCYTLACNYAMMSLVGSDFNRDVCFNKTIHNGNWIESIYNKNDGYQVAIGFEPYKGRENINIYRQKQLNDERLAALLIDSKKTNKPFFEDYYLSDIKLKFQKDYVSEKYNRDRLPENEMRYLFKQKNNFTYHILNAYGYEYFNHKDSVVRTAMAYLVYKTLSVGKNYPRYEEYRIIADVSNYAKQTSAFDKIISDEKKSEKSSFYDTKTMLSNLCAAIKKANTHSELKIRQVLNFLDAVQEKYQKEGESWQCPQFSSYQIYIKTMYPNFTPKSSQDILDFYPPQFFNDTIILKKQNCKIPLYALSSGEKQFMQTLATIAYHLRNIISVEDLHGLAKYKNVNLMFDEVETCFHPEFQQKFLKALIDLLVNSGITKEVKVNILLATHSPFILSDIPDSNILFLENGKIPLRRINGTFCGNVCELLEHSFFLQNGFMGHYAKDKVTDLISYLKDQNQEDTKIWDKDNSKSMINMIGEPLLKNSLMRLWEQKFSQNINELAEWHKKEYERLIKK